VIYVNLIITAIIVSEKKGDVTITTNFIPENTFLVSITFVSWVLRCKFRAICNVVHTVTMQHTVYCNVTTNDTKIAQHKKYTPLIFANLTF